MATFSSKSTLGDLLDNAAAKDVLAKYLPQVISSPQISQGRGMTLDAIKQFIPGLSADVLAQIDADLAKLS